MLVPTSKLKTNWSKSAGKKKYKSRSPLSLDSGAVKHYVALITAASLHDVREALSSLDLYDSEAKPFKCWSTAKALDDWRCVVSGPFVDSLWREYHDEPPAVQNKHRLWPCYGCHVASLWGPREHAYCCMEHEGQRSSSTLPTIFCRFACATCKAEPLASLPAPASGSSLATAGSSVIVLPVPV